MKKMKKIILSAGILLAAAALAGAQNMYDAIYFSQNNYFGTARSMALGNAVTALGGDLGSVGINPAGSAVAPYGQFVITPGLTISSVSSSYSPEGEDAFGLSNKLTNSRINMPNIGASFNFDTGNRYGLKMVTVAFLSNQTNNYNYSAEGFGRNGTSSKIAEFADAARGYFSNELDSYDSYYSTDIPWDLLAAYQGGMYGTYDGVDGRFVGVTETTAGDYHYLSGDLAQTSYRTKRGSKNDVIMNVGLNFSDQFYFGFNLGLPAARYRYSESFYESAVNPEQFMIPFEDGGTPSFLRGSYNYQYMADIAGVYAKVGFIYRPVKGLRLGASFQTPTAYTISESWRYSAATSFSSPVYDDSASSPEGEYSYNLRSPYLASFGAAFTFGKSGFISVDYEVADYSVMRFSNVHERRMREDSFQAQNMTNKYFAGLSHSLRLGFEMRVTPELALRAGYSMTTSPERWWTDNDGYTVTADDFSRNYESYLGRVKYLMTEHYYGDKTETFSAGIGYSSPGSFFMDAAVRQTRYPVTSFSPYYDYVACDNMGNERAIQAPRVESTYDLWNVALTLGWRF